VVVVMDVDLDVVVGCVVPVPALRRGAKKECNGFCVGWRDVLPWSDDEDSHDDGSDGGGWFLVCFIMVVVDSDGDASGETSRAARMVVGGIVILFFLGWGSWSWEVDCTVGFFRGLDICTAVVWVGGFLVELPRGAAVVTDVAAVVAALTARGVATVFATAFLGFRPRR
jgi:hypothetical protein